MGVTLSTRRPRRTGALLLVAVLAAVMWAVEIADLVLGDLDAAGIRPRDPDGLSGIALAPFLHAGFGHLLANTLPFLVLGATVALGGLARVAGVFAIVALVGGLGTWLTAPGGTVHIGASGIVLGSVAYLIARGVYSRRAWDLGVGLVVLGVYGATLVLSLVPTPGVSWQGHLFGAVGGVVAARWLHRRPARRGPAAWPDRA